MWQCWTSGWLLFRIKYLVMFVFKRLKKNLLFTLHTCTCVCFNTRTDSSPFCSYDVMCCHRWTLWPYGPVWLLCGSRCSPSLAGLGWWGTESSVTWSIPMGRGTRTPGTPFFWAVPLPGLTEQNRTSDCCIEICKCNIVCVAYQQWMFQDQTGPSDWTGWGSTRSGQHSFHSTGPAWSPESEHSTASRLPHLLPWWRLLSGSKRPVGSNIKCNGCWAQFWCNTEYIKAGIYTKRWCKLIRK